MHGYGPEERYWGRAVRRLGSIGQKKRRHSNRARLRCLTVATHAELAHILGFSRPDNVPNLTRRFARWLVERKVVCRRLRELDKQLEAETTTEKTRNLG